MYMYINEAVQQKKKDSGLKFRIKEVQGLYNLYSDNKAADLRLSFRIFKNRFSCDAAQLCYVLSHPPLIYQ